MSEKFDENKRRILAMNKPDELHSYVPQSSIIVSRNCTLPDVSTTQDVLTSIKTSNSIENTNPDYYKHDAGTWIPIASGRLPEKFQECIVLDKRRHVHNWIHYDALLPLFAQFTHWMPLPELPEEVK